VPIERPTFHESWYRVAGLHPRLRSTVQISRQYFRGQTWHVVQDHTNNAFFRLSEPAYRLIGLLDGRRSVGDAWKICNEQLGDDSPTQGETIQLFGQLYTSNLLQSELPADSATLFARYKKRVNREVQGFLMNLLFVRMPILDPDRFLDRTIWLFGQIFSWPGLVVWLILISIGVYNIGNFPSWQGEMAKGAGGILDPGNLPLLYLGFALIKACHEFGHAISCKRFGQTSGGGEVHVMGIMLLVFTPVPYVDASSSWAFQNKWQRAMVGAAGMWVELAIASLAAVVWAHSSGNPNLHALAFNMMFVASFSTIVFNANPLLRYDGYYILSDLLEIPNLSQRAKDFMYYLIKHYVWGIKHARNPAHTSGEQFWLFIYAIASGTMRVIVSVGILFFVADKLIILGILMTIAAIITWVLVPIGKFINYLLTSPELLRVRGRAIGSTALFIAVLAGGLGLIPVPDRSRAQGVIEPVDMMELHAGSNMFIRNLALINPPLEETDRNGMPQVSPDTAVLDGTNRDLLAHRDGLKIDGQRLDIAYHKALAEGEVAKGRAYQEQLIANADQIRHDQEMLDAMTLKTPMAGVVITPELEHRKGAYVTHGEKVGIVADLTTLMVRATAPQEIGGILTPEAHEVEPFVEFRINGSPDALFRGKLKEALPAGTNQLPSASLGYNAGGTMAVSGEDRQGTKTTEQFFEVRIDHLQRVNINGLPWFGQKTYSDVQPGDLLPGQRVVVRFEFKKKPVLVQCYTSVLQLFQRRFHT
jgi:putative peptide zinc metalloprotease protein